MKNKIYNTPFWIIIIAVVIAFGCKKEAALSKDPDIDFLAVKNNGPKNHLDSLIDTIQREYGVEVYYQFNPRIIDPTTFFTPTSYDRALSFTDLVLRDMWLAPLKQRFPKFLNEQKPVEFLITGSGIKFTSISAGDAAGAGLNSQFYRLGIGNVDNLSFTPSAIRERMNILYHEHSHQLDRKYGRGDDFNRVSQGDYYGISYTTRTDAQAQLDGFFRNYGGYAPEEDFATTVEACMRFPKDSIMRIIAKNPKLKEKYQIVYNKYLNWGLDLHLMHDYLDSAASKL